MDSYADIPGGIDFLTQFEMLYPDCFIRIHPHIRYIAESLSDSRLENITHDDIDELAVTALGRSGVMDDLPSGHTQQTIGNIAKALLIRDLHQRHKHRGGFSPFFLFPPNLHHGRRHHHHDDRHHHHHG